MTTTIDRNNPSFALFPINNNRTAWRPFGLPVILVVPNRRDGNGAPIANSQIFNMKIYIENAPKRAPVAGHDNIGKFFPDAELYTVNIDSLKLAESLVDPSLYTFYDTDGNQITADQATSGDEFEYTTSTGVTDRMTYYADANYYDLSPYLIDFDVLPSDNYNLVYQTEYFTRIISQDGLQQLLCIDVNKISLALYKFKVSHPGEVIEEFERLTPPPYLTNSERSLDTTLGLYRPFTDILQDVSDEQDLLESVNWVYETPPEVIPYLSKLLGWDIPYFPQSLDNLRKAVLRRTVEFQRLSGSKNAIVNLFRLFGFEILISNLWWSSDGKRYIRPDEKLPLGYEDQQITTDTLCQVDPLVSQFNGVDNKFGIFNIPLVYRPQVITGLDQFTALRDGGDVTIECYFVENDSEAYQQLTQIVTDISNNPSNYNDNQCTEIDGYLSSTAITNALNGKQLVGYSQLLISGKFGQVTNQILVGPEVPLTKEGVTLDRDSNILNITLNGALDYGTKNPRSVFCFATYKRQEIIVPDVLKDLQSNRFAIQVVQEDLAEFASSEVLDFVIEFLYKIKAFHSLLEKILLSVDLNETYEVTNWCVGGDYTQRYDTDAGRLQVPPAIIPNVPSDINDCSLLDPKNLGYKDSDILLRLRKLSTLPEEYQAWKSLDDRSDQAQGGERIAPNAPGEDRTGCKYTYQGQDLIKVQERDEAKESEIGPSPNASSMVAGFKANPKVSPIDDATAGQFPSTGGEASSNSDSSTYGLFTREYTEQFDPSCLENLGDRAIDDYCFKGRVDDETLYRQAVINSELFHSKPCSIDLGLGLYYLYPTFSQMIVKGVKERCPGSLTPYPIFSGGAKSGTIQQHLNSIQREYLTWNYDTALTDDSLLGRLLRDYDVPTPQTLHYTNRIVEVNTDQQYNLAIQRPSLNIEKTNLHFPGCRFVNLNALLQDFYHPTWRAKPWDDDFSTYCGPKDICGDNEPSFLNCTIEIGTDGNEYLVYDDQPFQALGNGLVPDITNLGDHTLGTDANYSENDAIHAVYMKDAELKDVIEFEGVCAYDSSIETLLYGEGILEVANPLFESHSTDCGTGIFDYADGYACFFGLHNYTTQDIGRGIYDSLLADLGMPSISPTFEPQVLINLGSGILDDNQINLRIDCGCLVYDCQTENTAPADDTICSANDFYDSQAEQYDWNTDHLSVTSVLKSVESLDVSSIPLDGTIPSLFELSS